MIETKLKILVAEDDYIIAADIKNCLEENGYDVISVVDNGKDVIRVSANENPDLILMDIILKGNLTGIDAAEIIYKFSNVPIIYLSALCDDETFLNAYSTKPFAYLIKPFHRTELLRKIKIVSGTVIKKAASERSF